MVERHTEREDELKGIDIDAERFRRLRDFRGLSQMELAEKANVTQVTISRIERGYPAIYATLDKVAQVLEVRPEELMKRNPLDDLLEAVDLDRPRPGRPRGTKKPREELVSRT